MGQGPQREQYCAEGRLCPPLTPAHCFLLRVGTRRTNSLEIEEGPWDPGPKVSATSVLRFRVAHHISPRLPDQRSDMLINPSQRAVLELWNFSLKPASYVDVSETRTHPQVYKTHVRCVTKVGSRAETPRESALGPRPCSVDALCRLSTLNPEGIEKKKKNLKCSVLYLDSKATSAMSCGTICCPLGHGKDGAGHRHGVSQVAQ